MGSPKDRPAWAVGRRCLSGQHCLLRTLNRGVQRLERPRGTGLVASKGCTLEEGCAETPEFSHVIGVGTCRLATREGKSWKGPQVIWADVGQRISPAEGCTVDFRLGGHVVSGHLCHPASVLNSSQTQNRKHGAWLSYTTVLVVASASDC